MKMTKSTVFFFAALSGCGVTTGKRVVLETEVKSELARGETFTNGLGWTVELQSAMISTGPFYYFDGEPAFTLAPKQPKQPSLMQEIWRELAPISTAYAHPGHYLAGNAKGQVLSPFSMELLDGPVQLPSGDGISGLFRSATFSYSLPSAGPAQDLLEGHVAMVVGRATKGEESVDFVAIADLSDIERTAKEGQITGCVFDENEVETDGKVTITIKPQVWFSLVDFADPFTKDSTSHIAFSLGLAQLSAYQAAFTAN